MKRPVVDPVASPKDEPSNTTLSRIGPTVVLRRRIVDAPTTAKAHASDAIAPGDQDEDESGPPSSVNVARALASLRADELTRLEQIMSDDEDLVPVAVAPPAAPAIPTVKLGPTIAVAELARRLGVAPEELVTACVTNGFFSVTIKAVLPRETARAVAGLFGWQTEDDDDTSSESEKAGARRSKKKPAAKKR